MPDTPLKPLGHKAYGHIAHLPGSRMGPADHKCHEGQARIATEKVRDRHDVVVVQEKLDGSCVAVAKVGGVIHPLGRAGWPALTSKYGMHHLFHDWVMERHRTFDRLLADGERVVGEWLAQAHGTTYDLAGRDPFVAFDIIVGQKRLNHDDFYTRAQYGGLTTPVMTYGPLSIEDAMSWVGELGYYGATEPVEGVVWRVERKGAVDFLVKYVRPDKVDGKYLDGEPVWNWRPEAAAA